MDDKNSRPKWWTLYLIVGSLFGLFLLESQAQLSETGHQLVQISMVLVIFIAIWMWYSANEQAILKEELQKQPKALRRGLEPIYLTEEIDTGRPKTDLSSLLTTVRQFIMAVFLWLISTVQNLFQR